MVHTCEVLAHKEELPEGWDLNPTNTPTTGRRSAGEAVCSHPGPGASSRSLVLAAEPTVELRREAQRRPRAPSAGLAAGQCGGHTLGA